MTQLTMFIIYCNMSQFEKMFKRCLSNISRQHNHDIFYHVITMQKIKLSMSMLLTILICLSRSCSPIKKSGPCKHKKNTTFNCQLNISIIIISPICYLPKVSNWQKGRHVICSLQLALLRKSICTVHCINTNTPVRMQYMLLFN